MHDGTYGEMSNQDIVDLIDDVNTYYDSYSTKFIFKIATIDPNGNCGIAINDVQTDSPFGSINNASIDIALKNQIRWPSNQYLNIWTVADIDNNSYSGYVLPPCTVDGSGTVPVENCLNFQDQTNANVQLDGVVFKYDEPLVVLVHEIAHWLSLWHTNGPDGVGTGFGSWVGCHDSSENLTNGDFVADTPPVDYANIGSSTNTCNLDSPDLDDDNNNLMRSQLLSLNISNQLTTGQLGRMESFLNNVRTNISSSSNLTATGTDNNHLVLDNPIIDQNTIWNINNTATTVDVMGDLRISANISLDINNVDVRFCGGGKLIVESGAKLIVNASKITSIGDEKWEGIELQGPASQFEALVLKGKSRVENAIVGVNSYGRSVDAKNTVFFNCDLALDLNVNTNPYSYVLINFCTFKNPDNPNFTMFINFDRWNGYASVTNTVFSSTSTSACIDEHGIGINAENTYFFSRGNTFKTLGHGVRVNAGTGQKPFVILESSFIGCYRGVTNSSVGNCKIWDNTFDLSSLPTSTVYTCTGGNDLIENQVGIHLEQNMTGIDIQENSFINSSTLTSIGIYGDGLGPANNKIRANSFETPYGLVGEGLNSTLFNTNSFKKGLYFSCNDFYSDEIGAWAVSEIDLSLRKIQFNSFDDGSEFSAANLWLNGNADDIINDNIVANREIEYYYDLNTLNEEPIEIEGVDPIDNVPFTCSNETANTVFGFNRDVTFNPGTNNVPTDTTPPYLPPIVTDQNNVQNDINVLITNMGSSGTDAQIIDGTGLWETNDALISEIIAAYQIYTPIWNESTYISYLMLMDNINGDYTAVRYYAGEQNWTDALSVLSNIPNKYTMTTNQTSDYNDLVSLYNILNNTAIDNLSPSQITSVEQVADGTKGNAKTWARSILNLYGQHHTSTFSLPLSRVRNNNLEEDKDYDILSIYPNPAANTLNISNGSVEPITHISVSSPTGKVIMETRNKEISQIDISELSSGLYIISSYDNNGIINTKKFIKL